MSKRAPAANARSGMDIFAAFKAPRKINVDSGGLVGQVGQIRNTEEKPKKRTLPESLSSTLVKPPPVLSEPTTLIIQKLKISLPVNPYGTQKAMMNQLLRAIDQNCNALLELPTGSGKSLALLCSLCAWLAADPSLRESKSAGRRSKSKPRRVFLASRTHSQITQLVKELKRTVYRPKMTVLGSRDRLCTNPSLVGKNKSEECEKLLEGNACSEFKKVDEFVDEVRRLPLYSQHGVCSAVDIEDLVTVAKKKKGCPYFGSRRLLEDAQLVICPYDYLVDSGVRPALGLDEYCKGAVVVFDEAHNIEDVCRDASSLDIDTDELNVFVEQCGALLNRRMDPDDTIKVEQLQKCLKEFQQWLHQQSNTLQSVSASSNKIRSFNGGQGLSVFTKVGFTAKMLNSSIKVLKKLASERNDEPGSRNTEKTARLSGVLSRFLSFVKESDDGVQVHRQDFHLIVQEVMKMGIPQPAPKFGRGRPYQPPRQRKVVSFGLWCMNPAIAFQELSNMCRSVILTSGTLSPMESFASELGAPFPIVLESKHVIDPTKQVCCRALTHVDGRPIRVVYQNTELYALQDDIGQALVAFARSTPHGVLVFFGSYFLMDRLIQRWKNTSIWTEMCAAKGYVEAEPRKGSVDDVLKKFRVEALSSTGAMLFAVCRGKVSEGLDFGGDASRGVCVVGIPFPAAKDTKTVLKREYNDMRKRSDPSIVGGSLWYELQAFRALNQAVGRCIRSNVDFGSILLLDERYKEARFTAKLSKWLRGSVSTVSNLAVLQPMLEGFFKENYERANQNHAKVVSSASGSTTSIPVNISTSRMMHRVEGLENMKHKPQSFQSVSKHMNSERGKSDVDVMESADDNGVDAIFKQKESSPHESCSGTANPQATQMFGQNLLSLPVKDSQSEWTSALHMLPNSPFPCEAKPPSAQMRDEQQESHTEIFASEGYDEHGHQGRRKRCKSGDEDDFLPPKPKRTIART